MTSGTILVLDLGTSRVKATLFTVEGHELAHTAATYPTYSPGPGFAEQHPADWWAASMASVRELWKTGQQPKNVQIISVTGQMHGIVPVRADNTPLGPCLTLRDRRASAMAAHLRLKLGEAQIYKITGARLDASSPPAKFLWYRYNTDLFSQISTFLAPKDWLRQELTGGETVTDPIEAAGMVIYDVVRGEWSPTIIEAAEITAHHLPQLRSPLDAAGTLRREAADALGLPAGINVMVGAADDVEFIGAGLLQPGDCLEHLGSTGSLLLVVDRPVEDPSGTLELYPHLLPGRWLIGGSTSSAGAALDWLRVALKSDTTLQLPDEPTDSQHEPPIFIPYLAGERSPIWEPDVRAVFWGLGMEHTQPDLIRGAFEGVAFSLRHLLDVLCSTGASPEQILVSPSDTRAWLNLRASVYERPLCLLQGYDPTALGAALLGSCALDVYPDLEQAVRAVVRWNSRVEPHADMRLGERYRRYRMLSELVRKEAAFSDQAVT